MLKKILWFGVVCVTLLIPQHSFATAFDEYVYNLIAPLRNVMPVLVGIAVAVFIWGVIKYMTTNEDPMKKEGARRVLVVGVVGIFILVSVWGLVAIVLTVFFGGAPGESSFYFEPPVPRSDPGNLINGGGQNNSSDEFDVCDFFPGALQGCY